MLYIACKVTNNTWGPTVYRGFETLSQSKVSLTEESLKDIIVNGIIQVGNASIQNNNIVLTEWVPIEDQQESENGTIHMEHSIAKYVIVAKEYNRYRLVDYNGVVSTTYSDGIKALAENGQIANCSIMQNEEKYMLKTTGIHTVQRDREFEKLIRSKYDSYIAKTLLLGLGESTFSYVIENHEVRMDSYTGTSTEIILPPFLTAISNNAFSYIGATTIKLNTGLKVIGTGAFAAGVMSKGIEYIEIPETVGLICGKAFEYNKKLFKANGTLNKEKFKLLGTKTVLMDQ